MWFHDYSKRFFQCCAKGDQALSPPWDHQDYDDNAHTTSNKNEQGPRLTMAANQRYPHGQHSDFGFDFDMKEAIPLDRLADNSNNNNASSGNALSRRSPLDMVENANAQMGLKWQSCEYYPSYHYPF